MIFDLAETPRFTQSNGRIILHAGERIHIKKQVFFLNGGISLFFYMVFCKAANSAVCFDVHLDSARREEGDEAAHFPLPMSAILYGPAKPRPFER